MAAGSGSASGGRENALSPPDENDDARNASGTSNSNTADTDEHDDANVPSAVAAAGSRSSPGHRRRDAHNGGGGGGSGGGRLPGTGGGPGGRGTFNDGGKGQAIMQDKLVSPASAAETGSTCSLSTAASHGLGGTMGGLGGGGGDGGGGGVALQGGSSPSLAVGTLTATMSGNSGMDSNPSRQRRNATHNNHLSRRERRALRRTRRRERQERNASSPTVLLLQLQTLSTTLGASLGLFLLFYLHLPALLFLMTTVLIGAIMAAIGYQYVRVQYTAVMSSGGFVQFLPDSMQRFILDALAGTTLHEWMTDPAFFMEYRYLLLYFIPGLDADQLDALVDRLPERHRRLLRQRGYLSGMTPASVRRMLVADAGEEVHHVGEEEHDRMLRQRGYAVEEGGGALVPSSLPQSGIVDGVPVRRQLFGEGEENEEDDGDTNNDGAYEPSTAELWADIAATVSSVLQGSGMGRRTLDVIQEEGDDDDDSVNVDGGVIIEQISSPTDSQEQQQEEGGDLTWDNDDDESVTEDTRVGDAIPPTVTTTLTRQASPRRGDLSVSVDNSSLASAARPQTSPPSQSPEEEQQIEGEILNDAVAEMTSNYINAATDAATSTMRNMFVGAVEYLTPGVVRFGLGTSFLSGVGLFGSYYMNFVRGHPLGWRRPLPRLAGSGDSGGGDGGSERETMTSTATYWTYGLMSTAFLGGTSAGFMLLLRNGVRRTIATERAENESKDESD